MYCKMPDDPDQTFLIQKGGRGAGRRAHFKKHLVSARQELFELRRILAGVELAQASDPSFVFDGLDSLRHRIRQLEVYIEFASQRLTGSP